MPSSIVSSTTPTGSNSPARACASGNPHDTAPTITPTSTIPLTSPPNANIINMTRGNAQPRGRHHVGTLAGFKSERVAGFRLECMAGFVGIRNPNHRDRQRYRDGKLDYPFGPFFRRM